MKIGLEIPFGMYASSMLPVTIGRRFKTLATQVSLGTTNMVNIKHSDIARWFL